MGIAADDRPALERLLRYCARPCWASERLTQADDGERLIYTFDKPRPDGSWQLTLTPLELLDRLARFIPPPRRHLHRYHGVFAPHAALRAQVAARAGEAVAAAVLFLRKAGKVRRIASEPRVCLKLADHSFACGKQIPWLSSSVSGLFESVRELDQSHGQRAHSFGSQASMRGEIEVGGISARLRKRDFEHLMPLCLEPEAQPEVAAAARRDFDAIAAEPAAVAAIAHVVNARQDR